MQVNGIVSTFSYENHTNSVTFQASRFVDKLLSRENATLPIPMPHFVAIELVVSELWPFEVGN